MASEEVCRTTSDVNQTISRWEYIVLEKLKPQYICILYIQSVNVVAEVAEFLQAYTKGLSPDNYEQIKEVFQALIEVCVGNPENQQVVLDKQAVEPINVILGLTRTAEKVVSIIRSTCTPGIMYVLIIIVFKHACNT